MSDFVTWSGFLKVGVTNPKDRPHNWRTTANLSVNKPSVSGFEVAVKVEVQLPRSLFIRPQLEAKITIPEHSVTPLTVDMEVTDNIEAILREQTGFDVRVLPIFGKEEA